MTSEGHTSSILQSGQYQYYSIADMQRLRSETRDGVARRWGSILSRRVILEMQELSRSSEPFLPCLYVGFERAGCAPTIVVRTSFSSPEIEGKPQSQRINLSTLILYLRE